MTPHIRPYTALDRAACASVFFHAVRTGAAGHYTQAQRQAWARSETPDLTTPDPLCDQCAWVAENDQQIIGFMSLTDTGNLDMAFVLPEAKGKGVADALYAALLSHAKTAHLPRLSVHASHLARRFFAKHGWALDHAENHPAHGLIYKRFQMSLDLKERVQ
jgi:putative acetyltransferase